MRKSRHHIFVSSLASGVYIIPRVRTAQSSDLLASSFFCSEMRFQERTRTMCLVCFTARSHTAFVCETQTLSWEPLVFGGNARSKTVK